MLANTSFVQNSLKVSLYYLQIKMLRGNWKHSLFSVMIRFLVNFKRILSSSYIIISNDMRFSTSRLSQLQNTLGSLHELRFFFVQLYCKFKFTSDISHNLSTIVLMTCQFQLLAFNKMQFSFNIYYVCYAEAFKTNLFRTWHSFFSSKKQHFILEQ